MDVPAIEGGRRDVLLRTVPPRTAHCADVTQRPRAFTSSSNGNMIPQLRSAITVALLALATASAPAQPVVDKNRSPMTPDQQFGIGLNNAGLHIQYAMGPAFHLGMNLNLDVNKLDNAKPDIYHFGPYAKFLFSGGVVMPYAVAAVGVLKPGTGKIGIQGRKGMPDSAYIFLPDAELSIKLAAGAEHFFSQNVGVYGQVNILHTVIHPTPNTLNLGLLGAVVGIEFFF
jgi:hypothetical protein